jgi:Tfp pilus assembly protein PilF
MRARLLVIAAVAAALGCSSTPQKMPSSELYLTERMATVFLQQGNALEAENAFRKVLVDDPDNAEMRNGHGLSLLMLGRPKEALIEFDKALKITDKESYLNNRGVARMELGDFAGAEADFLKAFGSPSPEDRQGALMNLGRTRMPWDAREAEEAFTRSRSRGRTRRSLRRGEAGGAAQRRRAPSRISRHSRSAPTTSTRCCTSGWADGSPITSSARGICGASPSSAPTRRSRPGRG